MSEPTKVNFWFRGPNGETDASWVKDMLAMKSEHGDIRAQYVQSWDIGVEDSWSVEFRWDRAAGQYVPRGRR